MNNGIEMPQIGYGVFQVLLDEAERFVADALSVGYRMIDTAQVYQNEKGGGVLFRKAVSNAKIFLLSIKYGFRSMQEILQQKASKGVCAN